MTMNEHEKYETPNGTFAILPKSRERSDWHCYLFGDEGIVINPAVGNVPNRFHRKVHELVFGVRWVRKPATTDA